jgi:anti-sigma factor ChrR (cupin superfamily)
MSEEVARVPGVTQHLDEFSLLCYSAGELGSPESSVAASHLASCSVCRSALREIRELDSELRSLAKAGDLERELAPSG